MSQGPADASAFRLAFDHNYRDVLAFAARRVALADAEEVTAETFAIAWRKWARAPEGAIRPWLFGIARNVLANRRRSLRRQDRLAAKASRLGLEAHLDPDRIEHLLVQEALARLNGRDREIIRLHCWEGLGPAELAIALSCTPNAAGVRLHRAKRRLAGFLDQGDRP